MHLALVVSPLAEGIKVAPDSVMAATSRETTLLATTNTIAAARTWISDEVVSITFISHCQFMRTMVLEVLVAAARRRQVLCGNLRSCLPLILLADAAR